jgi:hypothetical protein
LYRNDHHRWYQHGLIGDKKQDTKFYTEQAFSLRPTKSTALNTNLSLKNIENNLLRAQQQSVLNPIAKDRVV